MTDEDYERQCELIERLIKGADEPPSQETQRMIHEVSRFAYERGVKILKDTPSDCDVVPAVVGGTSRAMELTKQAFKDADRGWGPCQCGDEVYHSNLLICVHERLRCSEYLYHDPLYALKEQQRACLSHWRRGGWDLVSPLYKTTIQNVLYHGFTVRAAPWASLRWLVPWSFWGLLLVSTVAGLVYLMLALVQRLRS